MYPADPHVDHPSEVLTYRQRLTAAIRGWAWAMSSSDIGGNLDASDFEGIATIATTLEMTLEEAGKHTAMQCDCFKDAKDDAAKDALAESWGWPLTKSFICTHRR